MGPNSPHPRKYFFFISDNALAYNTTPDPSAIPALYLTSTSRSSGLPINKAPFPKAYRLEVHGKKVKFQPETLLPWLHPNVTLSLSL